MYRVDAYFLSKQLADLPMFLFIPAFFISILYYMVRLNPGTTREGSFVNDVRIANVGREVAWSPN